MNINCGCDKQLCVGFKKRHQLMLTFDKQTLPGHMTNKGGNHPLIINICKHFYADGEAEILPSKQ